jgi:hypothetical protein
MFAAGPESILHRTESIRLLFANLSGSFILFMPTQGFSGTVAPVSSGRSTHKITFTARYRDKQCLSIIINFPLCGSEFAISAGDAAIGQTRPAKRRIYGHFYGRIPPNLGST